MGAVRMAQGGTRGLTTAGRAVMMAAVIALFAGIIAIPQGSNAQSPASSASSADPLSEARDAVASIRTNFQDQLSRLQEAHESFMSGGDDDDVDVVDQILDELQSDAEDTLRHVRENGAIGDLFEKTRSKAEAQIAKLDMMGLSAEEKDMLVGHWTASLEQFEAEILGFNQARDHADQVIRDLGRQRPLLREMWRIKKLDEITSIISEVSTSITSLSSSLESVIDATYDMQREQIDN